MKKILKGSIITGLIMVMFSTVAFAGTTYSYYNTTVGKFNGSGYSGYQTKVTSGANGLLKSSTVGGNYTVDARMSSTAGNGAWLRNVDDGTVAYLDSPVSQVNGCSVRCQFSNDITTPVDVQVTGYWKCN
mgnify:CR=1 FL=1